jgi:hypothetical protein
VEQVKGLFKKKRPWRKLRMIVYRLKKRSSGWSVVLRKRIRAGNVNRYDRCPDFITY